MHVAVHGNDRKHELENSPGLHGPDYFSLIIEWEQPQNVNATSAAPRAVDQSVQSVQAWDVVDEASLESFPASDPPAWGSSGVAAATAESAAASEPNVQALDDRPGLAARIAKIVVGVGAAVGATFVIRHRRHTIA